MQRAPYNGGMNTFQAHCEFCGNSIIRKQVSAKYFCNKSCKGSWQRINGKPVTEEWLRDAYLVKKMDCTSIAHIVGRDPKSVWNWLKGFGIETRKRGTTDNWIHSIGADRILTEFGRLRLSESAKKARAKDGRAPYLKNGIHWLKHPGVTHPSWKGGITPERQSFYASEEWVDSVKKVWKRDKAICQRCGKSHNDEKNRGNFHIHHLTSFSVVSLRANVDNLILVCKECHRWIHSKKNTKKEFINECSGPSNI